MKTKNNNWTRINADKHRLNLERNSFSLSLKSYSSQRKSFLRKSALISVLFVFLFALPVYAQSVEDIQVLKISPQDERAIIKINNGENQIIKPNDKIKSYQPSAVSDQQKNIKQSTKSGQRSATSDQQSTVSEFRVVEITTGRVVLEEVREKGTDTIIIRLENGKQTVQRISTAPEKKPEVLKPQKSSEFKVQSTEDQEHSGGSIR